jgi:hypothetical protein
MTLWLSWGLEDDAALRPRYLQLTGEAVQDHPTIKDQRALIGSSVLTIAVANMLAVEFLSVQIHNDFPEGFNDD